MNEDYELYDENNPDHNNPELYEVVEYSKELVENHRQNTGAEVGTIEEDAERRDFVNSCIYFSLKTSELIDPSGMAILDCQNNVLRFMGKPKDRIKEDPLRVFRAYKFIQRGWEVEPKTLRAVRENFEYATKTVNPERIRLEVEKMVGL
jgi:tRNA nucleotidyltransferase/poly(A) polymerase